MSARYDQIGKTYTSTRAADPRIVQRILALLDLPLGSTILDVGAGTGNYSQVLAELGLQVHAIEPSLVMREQAKSHPRLHWYAGSAEDLPFPDGHFDGVIMTLCIHHFSDWQRGLREAMRVSKRGPLVVLGFDIEFEYDFWLYDYIPEFIEVDQILGPTIGELAQFTEQELKVVFHKEAFPLPRDLVDHFACADWARPHNYLEKRYRDGISTFHKLDQQKMQAGLDRLQADLDDGTWQEKYGELLKREEFDQGYVFMRFG